MASVDSLFGSSVRLRPIEAPDIPYLYRLSVGGTAAQTYRFRGTTPSPDQFTRLLWEGVLAQFCVEPKELRRPIGLVTLYGADLRSGHVKVSGILDEEFSGHRAVEAFELVIDFAFRSFPIRKVYGESPEYNVRSFRTVFDVVAVEEGRLVAHEYLNGKYYDFVHLAIYRDRWIEHRARKMTEFASRVRDLERAGGSANG